MTEKDIMIVDEKTLKGLQTGRCVSIAHHFESDAIFEIVGVGKDKYSILWNATSLDEEGIEVSNIYGTHTLTTAEKTYSVEIRRK